MGGLDAAKRTERVMRVGRLLKAARQFFVGGRAALEALVGHIASSTLVEFVIRLSPRQQADIRDAARRGQEEAAARVPTKGIRVRTEVVPRRLARVDDDTAPDFGRYAVREAYGEECIPLLQFGLHPRQRNRHSLLQIDFTVELHDCVVENDPIS